MRVASAASLVAATALVVAACGGGDGGSSTTTSAPPSTEASTTSAEPTTTSTTIDPALKELLLVKEDLPTGFEEAPASASGPAPEKPASACDAADAPAGDAIENEPSADGATFVRGSGDIPVEVSSSVTRTTPEKAEGAATEFLEAKLHECKEADFKSQADSGLPAGATPTFKTSATKANVSGIDQAVLLTSTATADAAGQTLNLRFDIVVLRQEGTLYLVTYSGTTPQASSAERQRIVAVAAKKLTATASGTSSTTAGSGGSSTSSIRGSSTTGRSTSTTRRGATTSSSRASTTSTTR